MNVLVYFFIFDFSSRIRHTRCSRDWSSDVCSSDLPPRHHAKGKWALDKISCQGHGGVMQDVEVIESAEAAAAALDPESGRASCRERLLISQIRTSTYHRIDSHASEPQRRLAPPIAM